MRFLVILFLALLPLQAQAAKLSAPQTRDINLYGEIDDVMANDIVATLYSLDAENHDTITIHIQSPGGSVEAGLHIYDAMRGIHSPVKTICEVDCMSMAAVILASGDVREAAPHSNILVHQLSAHGIGGTLNQMINEVRDCMRLQASIDAILVKDTHLTTEQIQALESYDHFMPPEEALQDGLIDLIQTPVKP